MDLLEAAQILAAGVAAGAINTLVGSGTLITFPVLLALGYPPVVANASNTVGLVPGSMAGAWAYRAELATQRHLLLRLGTTALLGGITGAVLLLVLPAEAFRAVVPVLICLALVLVVLQPWLSRRLRERREAPAGTSRSGLLLTAGIFATSVYGGYFGAAQGVLLLGILGLLVPATLQQLNGVKNVFAGLVNAVAAVIFIGAGTVSWPPVALIAAGSIAGSLVAGRYGRRLPDSALRGVIVVVGLTAVVRML
ncbi:sulfite exporter TauE/SafE family protein [Actinoplanes aureus]|uniref:Probable membrane transporter protein n=1 Tax=Actinoplanes aureus TaxID=2792083 RepID=A0A931CAB4_9ACTN|nr:sulfite exporter TauE/SafE family protein [Actinoplanes aureus]MBG0564287.1 sulfite exporter TauE/SafE family protein [Actinoplanes aureus]